MHRTSQNEYGKMMRESHWNWPEVSLPAGARAKRQRRQVELGQPYPTWVQTVPRMSQSRSQVSGRKLQPESHSSGGLWAIECDLAVFDTENPNACGCFWGFALTLSLEHTERMT